MLCASVMRRPPGESPSATDHRAASRARRNPPAAPTQRRPAPSRRRRPRSRRSRRRRSRRSSRTYGRGSRIVTTMTVVVSRKRRGIRASKTSNDADENGERRAIRSSTWSAWRAPRPMAMSAKRVGVRVKPAAVMPNDAPSAASERTSEAATTYSASTSCVPRSAMSQPRPPDVWMSSASRTSRSRDGSKRLVMGAPSRALVRAWTRRSGSPGLYGRTPAKRDGSSISPARARSRSPQRSGRASSGTGTTFGHTTNWSTSSMCKPAASRASRSPTDTWVGPIVWTPRLSEVTHT